MNYEEYDLAELERAVADAKALYKREADKRQGGTATLWNHYARLLHTLRLRKRALNND